MRSKSVFGFLLAAAVVAWVVSCGGPPPPPLAEVDVLEGPDDAVPEGSGLTPDIRVEDVGLATPESVLYDRAAGIYLVANINGGPAGRDGNGFISRIAPDGMVVDLKWIDGADPEVTLDAPKGMAIVGDTLYVADITMVRLFDRAKGTSLGEIKIPGSTFVNDVAAGLDGTVVVSDSDSSAVYRIGSDLQLAVVARAADLEGPNGLLEGEDRGLVVAPYGSNVVYTLGADGRRTDLAKLPTGGLDGLVETIDGRLLVSSWEGGAVYAIDREGGVLTFAEGLTAPADLGYDPDRDAVIVPLFKDDALVIMAAGSAVAE